jgi:hypothetical protein
MRSGRGRAQFPENAVEIDRSGGVMQDTGIVRVS